MTVRTDSELKILDFVKNTTDNFLGGKVKHYLRNWEMLTSDKTILEYIRGVSVPPLSNSINYIKDKKEIIFSEVEKVEVEKQIRKFLQQGVIHKVNTSDCNSNHVLSNIFLRPKPDGTHRMILNLKCFNECIEKVHFKMDTLISILRLIKENCFFAKIDLKDAFFSIPINCQDRKFFRFLFNGVLYEFCCLPQGYRESPRLFTKILKVPLSFLRSLGYINSGYLDDIYVQGDNFEECNNNLTDTIHVLDSLGFTINSEKSVFTPSTKMEFLGFILDSRTMLVHPNEKKCHKIITLCEELLTKHKITLRKLSETIGHLISVSPGNIYASIFYKRLEILKNAGLKQSKGNYEEEIAITDQVREDLQWWKENVGKFPKPISQSDVDFEMYTDASLSGFGISCNGKKTGGLWSEEEKALHINILELMAVKFGLYSFCKQESYKHIKIFTDNSTTVSCLNKMGSCKPSLNNITREIWLFCAKRNLFLTISHIPGSHNTIADNLSRKHRNELEWKLNPNIFNKVNNLFGPFDMDMFASRINCQLEKYVSWKPDPKALFIDAFTLKWDKYYSYCFPPFSLIARILQKVENEKADICIILPWWKNQTWFPKLGNLLVDFPVLLPQGQYTLIQPSATGNIHPLSTVLKLVACKISGKHWKNKEFLSRLQISSCLHGDQVLLNSMKRMRNNSLNFVAQGRSILVNRQPRSWWNS